MLNVTELRSGTTFRDNKGMWEVVKYSHTKMGRGSANIKLKIKNLNTGATIEKTFTSGQKVDELSLSKKKGQFLYNDVDNIVFMDPVSFEQFTLPRSLVGRKEKFLKEGETYDLLVAQDQVLSIEIPKLATLSVAETGPGVKGDTVSATTKDATLENGLRVKVPLFINQDDRIKVDTRTGEYVERVKQDKDP
ncbi:elongation factor P [Patescibacteria group bacterium]|nr:elongation factor P [Patescibacteria group bacterium]